MAFKELRQEYDGLPLFKKDCAKDPHKQFDVWFAQAVNAKIEMANAMTLATVGDSQIPRARIVLLKELDDKGFVFFTNYESRKAKEIADNTKASLLFWWHPHARQILIEGSLEKISAQESDAYFNTRPRESNLAAMGSLQSQPVEDRAALEASIQKMEEANKGKNLVRPSNWGGYRLVASEFEFWQGRPDRTHDRIQYKRVGSTWEQLRLYP